MSEVKVTLLYYSITIQHLIDPVAIGIKFASVCHHENELLQLGLPIIETMARVTVTFKLRTTHMQGSFMRLAYPLTVLFRVALLLI